MHDYFQQELLKRSLQWQMRLEAQMLNEEDRKVQPLSFMWLFQSGEDGLLEIILYGYFPTRIGSHAKEFLKGYNGYPETDGYLGYNNLPRIRRFSC